MLTTRLPSDPEARRLLQLHGELGPADRATLLAFAEFLVARGDTPPVEAAGETPPPEIIPRPAQESVVAAMRRLSATYHMLDKGKVLHEASSLMGAHIMHGRAAADVIDDLEALFRRAYDDLLAERQD